METYALLSLTLSHGGWTKELEMESAELALVTEAGSRLWYIDVNGVADDELLDYFYTAADIGVEISALARDGRMLEGTAYFHANKLHRAAALRGDGELKGV
ncbi:hypothetical protein HGI30_07025 [Paenibacillus albicereus]|uniref:Uncharacterized protein n=1 Tax=Paenibacillus albicereus TaxID=2726185 RepID=A0A6H2GV65_9BACL|nr:hypothetical protein [Paenibacillus albicereus]QJC51321.1 hypothetical protein HGI30_07025 [Paenibacillus albicereus]